MPKHWSQCCQTGKRYDHPAIPSMFVGWDNTARRGENAVVITNTSPEAYGRALTTLIQEQQRKPAEERSVINAWNEWAEGNHLEPDMQNGRAYLECNTGSVGTFAKEF